MMNQVLFYQPTNISGLQHTFLRLRQAIISVHSTLLLQHIIGEGDCVSFNSGAWHTGCKTNALMIALLKRTIIAVAFFCYGFPAIADHLKGGYIRYEYKGADTDSTSLYAVTITIFNRCGTQAL